MKNTYFILLSLFILSACSSVPNNNLVNTNYDATKHVFLSDVLPPPPIPGSAADKKDMAEILNIQKTRNSQQTYEAQLDAHLDIFRFESAIGNKFTLQNLPLTAAFFEKMINDEKRVIELAKVHYMRPRPYETSTLVIPVVTKPLNSSYPSGHACLAYVSAIFLAKMVPEKAPQIFERAAEYAHNRVVAGVHYPTDVEAGKISASVFANDLLQDKQFMADFEQAKQEVRKALQL